MLGISLFFAGISLWIAVAVYVSGVLLLALVPVLPVVFLAGLCTNAFQRTRPWPAFRAFWAWSWARRELFRFKVSGHPKAVELYEKERTKDGASERKRIIWAIYPHGHFSLTAAFLWGTDPKLSHTVGAVHSVLFWLPFVGSLVGWLGCTTVSETDMKRVLTTGTGRLFMCPGGVADASNTGSTVKKRRGFLRVARETGAVVVPVWAPQERSYYRQWLPLGRTLEKWLFFPVPMFIWGRWWCPLLPRHVEASPVLLGEPIDWEGGRTLEEGERLYWERLSKLQAR